MNDLEMSGRVVAVTSGDHRAIDGGFCTERHSPLIVIALDVPDQPVVVVPSPSGAIMPVGAHVELLIRLTDERPARRTPT